MNFLHLLILILIIDEVKVRHSELNQLINVVELSVYDDNFRTCVPVSLIMYP